MTLKHTQSIAMNALASLLGVVIVGCAHSQATMHGRGDVPAELPMRAPVPAAVAPLLPLLLADAAKRSGVPQDRLRVVRAVAVTWSDGSLGCPQPGFGYTQALVPGWLVSIAVPSSDAPLLYHGSDRGGWLHCPAGRASPTPPASADPRI